MAENPVEEVEEQKAMKKRKLEELDTSGLGIEGLTLLSNQHFDLVRLTQAMQDLLRARIRVLKLENKVESLSRNLGDVPAVKALVDTMEKEYRRCLDNHAKEIREAQEPKKKKKKAASSSSKDPAPESQMDQS